MMKQMNNVMSNHEKNMNVKIHTNPLSAASNNAKSHLQNIEDLMIDSDDDSKTPSRDSSIHNNDNLFR